MVNTLFVNPTNAINQTPLNPQLNYLRVDIAGLQALMVRGYIDQDKNGPIDVWYSSDGSILRLQKGRYLGSVGFDRNWRNVVYNNVPDLQQALGNLTAMTANAPVNTTLFQATELYFLRSHLAMPGTVAVVAQRVALVLPQELTQHIPQNIPTPLQGYLRHKDVAWIAERSLLPIRGDSAPAQAMYGLEKSSTGYQYLIGQQCLSEKFCITWMPWPIR